MSQKREDVGWLPKKPGPLKTMAEFTESRHADLAKKLLSKFNKKRKRK